MNPKKKTYVAPAPGGQSSQEGVADAPILRMPMPGPATEVVPVPAGVWVFATAGPPLTPEEAIRLRACSSVPVPELFVTIRRLEGSDLNNLPPFAADVIHQVSRLEEAEGGGGMVFVLDGSREEQDGLVLRLLPKRADSGAGSRLAKVAAALDTLRASVVGTGLAFRSVTS